jgi:uncharacterized protein
MIRVPNDYSLKEIFSESILFRGHENILGTHQNTLEITKDPEITRRADCIIGVRAGKSCAELDMKLVDHIRREGRMAFVIMVEDLKFRFMGFGSKSLQLTDPEEIVLRRSDYASPRTLAVRCNAAAVDIPRDMVKLLQDPDVEGVMKISAIEGTDSISTPSPIEFA